jgi:hypothetical protein
MDFSTSTDVLVEILLRLPPSARRRARLVCKMWRESVDDRTTEMQSRAQPLLWNTRAAVAYIDGPSTGSCTDVWRSSRPCADPYADADLQLVGTCNGLLCLCDNDERSGGAVTLVNPATGESLLVPPLPCTEYVFGRRRCRRRWDKAYSFGYHPLTGRYKIVHVPGYLEPAAASDSIDEVQVFNLAATRPDLLTGVNPATGQPAPYGSVGVDINCAVIGFTNKAPTANLADPVPNSQFPPR